MCSCPDFSVSMICIDMLPCCDLGVAQDALGNLFFEVMPSLGENRSVQIKALWCRIKQYYKLWKPTTEIQSLTQEVVKRPCKSPKLRTKGSETRGLIPFGAELSREFHESAQTDRSIDQIHTGNASNLSLSDPGNMFAPSPCLQPCFVLPGL